MQLLTVLIMFCSILLCHSWSNHDTGQDIYCHCSFAPISTFPSPLFQISYHCSMSTDAPNTCVPADDDGFQEVLGRGRRPKNPERMNALIQAEQEDNGQPLRRHRQPHRLPKKSAISKNDNLFSTLSVEDASDADDGDFTGDGSESSSE
ncbi:hypothetical protein BDR03DRAFT_906074 [Suillus americanus]|nr:hypothetical protein BDR03DRAFT_906074 [Suillus americanus]